MRPNSSVKLLLVCLTASLAFIDLGIIIYLISSSCITTKRVENAFEFPSRSISNATFVNIAMGTTFLFPPNTHAMNLARIVNSSLNETKPSLLTIETKVAPHLFLAFKTLQLSQISYIGSAGAFYSYYREGNQTLVLYSNTLKKRIKGIRNASLVYDCYMERVDNDVGKRYETDERSKSLTSIDLSWLQELLLKSTNYASLGRGWERSQEHMFFSAVAMDGLGIVSLGFPMKAINDAISRINRHEADSYLVMRDGTILVQTGPHSVELNNGRVSILFANSSEDLATHEMIDISCEHNDELLRRENMSIGGRKYTLYCMPLDIAGVPSVFIMVFPRMGLLGVVQNYSRTTLVLSVLLLGSLVITFISFTFLIITMVKREMFLSATLIKQKEATQQEERRTKNKSMAFASASHDIRSSLAAIDGIITLCSAEVAPNSEVHMNLEQMRTFTADLIGLISSVLDTSKIDAGMMQLREEEFYMGQVLEESVNLYYPGCKDKGIDLVLDPCDGSVDKHPLVKGDRGKLKQVLNNLLHNAIKFTSDGHIVVRAWAKKPGPQNSVFSSKNTRVGSLMSRLIHKKNETYNDFNSLRASQHTQNAVEFIIEVDDTGKGIPKDQQKSVFENFVQVKGTATDQGGTGLGLGIVQSLVRLMGGDIGIVDKDLAEKGTCFRFNIFLSTCGATFITSSSEGDKTSYQIPMELNQNADLNIQNKDFQTEGSHVLLFIQRGERRRVLQKFLLSIGINVSTVDRQEDISPTLERIKHTSQFTHVSSSRESDLDSQSDQVATDGIDYPLPFHRKTTSTLSFILVIVDFSANDFNDERFSELCLTIESFKRDIGDSRCKVVWLYTPKANVEARRIDEKKLAKSEHIMSKPLHGSRLYQLLKLLPEFGGATVIQGYRPSFTGENAQVSNHPPGSFTERRDHDIQEVALRGGSSSCDKLLYGKNVLVAEDTPVLLKFATHFLRIQGAVVQCCENGQEAVEQVLNALQENGKTSSKLPYDFIFMDCQMPIMDGYEATRKIRLEEKLYNIHLPIIALTANEETDERERAKIILAGMDAIITKPLNKEKLFAAINSI